MSLPVSVRPYIYSHCELSYWMEYSYYYIVIIIYSTLSIDACMVYDEKRAVISQS